MQELEWPSIDDVDLDEVGLNEVRDVHLGIGTPVLDSGTFVD